jgi:hypothetical protein
MAIQDNTPSEFKPALGAPDFDNCRARSLGFSDIVFCLKEDPRNCIYSLRFDTSFFCIHPQRLEIVARTKAAQPHH